MTWDSSGVSARLSSGSHVASQVTALTGTVHDPLLLGLLLNQFRLNVSVLVRFIRVLTNMNDK